MERGGEEREPKDQPSELLLSLSLNSDKTQESHKPS